MKNKLESFALAIVLLAIGVVAVGCTNNGIDGTWVDEDGEEYIFNVIGDKLAISSSLLTKKEEKSSKNKGATSIEAIAGTWVDGGGYEWFYNVINENKFTASVKIRGEEYLFPYTKKEEKPSKNKGLDGIWVSKSREEYTFNVKEDKLTISDIFTKKEEKSSKNKGATGIKAIAGTWISIYGEYVFDITNENEIIRIDPEDGEILETYTKKEEKPSKNKGATGAKALVGTWKGDMGITWSFTGNKFTQRMMGIKTTVPYKIKGNSIATEYEGAEVEMEFEIEGDTLTIEIIGFPMKFERVK